MAQSGTILSFNTIFRHLTCHSGYTSTYTKQYRQQNRSDIKSHKSIICVHVYDFGRILVVLRTLSFIKPFSAWMLKKQQAYKDVCFAAMAYI